METLTKTIKATATWVNLIPWLVGSITGLEVLGAFPGTRNLKRSERFAMRALVWTVMRASNGSEVASNPRRVACTHERGRSVKSAMFWKREFFQSNFLHKMRCNDFNQSQNFLTLWGPLKSQVVPPMHKESRGPIKDGLDDTGKLCA